MKKLKIVVTAFGIFCLSQRDITQQSLTISQDKKVEAAYMGRYVVTSYQSKRSQTDSTPFSTSIGVKVGPTGIAVSQDQLCLTAKQEWLHGLPCKHCERIHYYDLVYVEGVGYRFVTDCMNKRFKNRWDVWVSNQQQEASFHRKYGHTKLKIWKVVGHEQHRGTWTKS